MKYKKIKIIWLIFSLDLIILLLHILLGNNFLFFNLDKEFNLPTIYSSLKLFLLAYLFLLIWKSKSRNFKNSGLILSLIFLYIGFDELFQIHELLSYFLNKKFFNWLNIFNVPIFYWILLYSPAILFTLFIFYKFITEELTKFKKFSKIQFILSLISLILVILFEFLGGLMINHTSLYHFFTFFEECFEFIAVSLLINGLIGQIKYLPNNIQYQQSIKEKFLDISLNFASLIIFLLVLFGTKFTGGAFIKVIKTKGILLIISIIFVILLKIYLFIKKKKYKLITSRLNFKSFVSKYTYLFNFLLLISSFTWIIQDFTTFFYKKHLVLNTNNEIIENWSQRFVVGYEKFKDLEKIIQKNAVGGIYITKRNLKDKTKEEFQTEIAKLQTIRKNKGLTPLIIAADHEGGFISQLHLGSFVTKTKTLGEIVKKSNNEADLKYKIENIAQIHSEDLQKLGINMNFAPVIDIKFKNIDTSKMHSQISQRSISDNPYEVAKIGLIYTKNLEKNNIIPTLKHFPGLGRITQDTHSNKKATVKIKFDKFKKIDLIPFRSISKNSNSAIMLSHITIKDIDPNYPVSASKKFVNEVIRQDLEMNNILITDDFSMGNITANRHGFENLTIESLNSGVDLILISYNPDLYYEAMFTILDSEKRKILNYNMHNKSLNRIEENKRKILNP